jgi:hypothetical protein
VYITRQISSRLITYSEFIPHSPLQSHNSQSHNYCRLQYHKYFYCSHSSHRGGGGGASYASRIRHNIFGSFRNLLYLNFIEYDISSGVTWMFCSLHLQNICSPSLQWNLHAGKCMSCHPFTGFQLCLFLVNDPFLDSTCSLISIRIRFPRWNPIKGSTLKGTYQPHTAKWNPLRLSSCFLAPISFSGENTRTWPAVTLRCPDAVEFGPYSGQWKESGNILEKWLN